MIYRNIIDTIGNTPLVYLDKLKETYNLKANIIAKIEKTNPGGSIKDRVVKKIIEDALNKGLINSSTVLMEATSGNTGIALAMIGALKGLRVIIVMPSSASKERIKIMNCFGAEVILTDSKKGMAASIEKLEELKKEHKDHFVCDQFNNYNSVNAHYETTAQEIYDDLKTNVDYIVSGIGTGGTIMGISKFFKNIKSSVKIIGVEPYEAAAINKLPFSVNKIEGLGAKFIPSIVDLSMIDEVAPVRSLDAISMSNKIACIEGILCGPSSGAALFKAMEIAKLSENENKNIVVIFPDSKERYLSNEDE